MKLRDFQDSMEGMLEAKSFTHLKEGHLRGFPGEMITSPTGSVTATMQKHLREMMQFYETDHDMSRIFSMDPGNQVRVGPKSGYDIGTALPVATDVWYLAIGPSILPFTGENYQELSTRILGFLSAYLEKLDNIKPLRSLQSYADISTYMDWSDFRKHWETESVPNVIREMRFETWMFNRNTNYPSKGPKASVEAGKRDKPETSMGQLYGGLLSFPVGMLGVMEVTSIFSESMIAMLAQNVPIVDATTANVNDNTPSSAPISISWPVGWKCVTDPVLDGFMSPMTDMTGMCPGIHMVEKGYVTVSGDAEYPAEPFAGFDKILPFHSLRYYLRQDARWPTPGEFVGLLAKPFPTHVWWFQKSSPLLYSGNWVETNHYTSGIVKEKMVTDEDVHGSVYKCVVRGIEICIATSDFYEYSIGERVAIVRLNDLDRFTINPKGNFLWKDMEDLIAREKYERETPSNLPYIVNPNMMIVPMSFYQQNTGG
jgi:hypothetical protein